MSDDIYQRLARYTDIFNKISICVAQGWAVAGVFLVAYIGFRTGQTLSTTRFLLATGITLVGYCTLIPIAGLITNACYNDKYHTQTKLYIMRGIVILGALGLLFIMTMSIGQVT